MHATVRLLIDGPQSPARNMAVDEALLRLCRVPVLRFYQWSEPAVSIGYFQKLEDVPEGRTFIRRYTGGGLVDHAADFTYTVVTPKDHALYAMGTACSYEAIHRAVAQALEELGCVSVLAEKASEVESGACFAKPVKFDVVSGVRKLAGAAQRRTREGCLHQGSVLVDSISFERMTDTFGRRLAPLLGESPEASSLEAAEQELATKLETERYRTAAWNQTR